MNKNPEADKSDFSTWKPFVDFYQRHGISPVHQDISDLSRHFERRAALYRHLGLSPGLLEGRSVIEFGPGSGHNALFTTALKPRRYVLVDGNPKGLDEAKALIGRSFPRAACHEYVEALIEQYLTGELFDCVFCEGVIPAQVDPAAFTRMVSRFVKPGGLLVITCVDAVSMFSETIRRLMRGIVVPRGTPVPEQVEILLPVFSSHFETLQGASRSVRDWLVDAIIHPIWGSIFSIPEAIGALGADFDFYGSSPHFVEDWRWYKQLHGGSQRYNDTAAEAYRDHVANFIDYRVVLPPQDAAISAKIIANCEHAFSAMQKIENEGQASALQAAVDGIEELARLFAPISELTSVSLAEAAAFLRRGDAGGACDLKNFRFMFGRGQSYASFIRRGLPLDGAAAR